MTENSKSRPSALIALARTRRMQRAMAHAYLHRNEPPGALRNALEFVTETACVGASRSEDAGGVGHYMWIAGVASHERVAYVVEELGRGDAPIIYRLFLAGPRHGHLVPIRAWYERADDAHEIRSRLVAVQQTLLPVAPTTTEAFMLSTRVVQRRALRVVENGTEIGSIRKFALQLAVEPTSGTGPSGKTTVTAFLRPNAMLADVWLLPDGDALARVTYTGIPSGVGLTKDTVVLLTDLLR